MGLPWSSDCKESACSAETWIRSLGQEDSLGEVNGNPLQYSCLENSTDRGAWWATVLGITKSWIQLSNYHFSPIEYGKGLGDKNH